MKWYERFGVALNSFGTGVTALKDVFTSTFDEDDKTVGDIVGGVFTAGSSFVNAGFQAQAGVASGAIEAMSTVTQPVNDLVHRAGATVGVASNLAHSSIYARSQGLQPGTLSTTGSLTVSPETWSKAWDMAKNISYGQSLAFNGTDFFNPWNFNANTGVDILDKKKVDELKDSVLFNAFSGINDAVLSWYSDPTAAVGKVVSAGKRVQNVYRAGADEADPWLERLLFSKTPLGEKLTNPDLLADSDKMNQFLAWASGRSARQIISHPIFKANPRSDDFAAVIAGLLDREDLSTARLVMAVGYGSLKAKNELAKRGDDLLYRLQAVENETNHTANLATAAKATVGDWITSSPMPLIPARGGSASDPKIAADLAKLTAGQKPGSIVDSAKEMQRLAYARDERELELITAAIGKNSEDPGLLGTMIQQVPRGKRQNSKADRLLAYDEGSFSRWEESLFYPKAFGIPLRVVSYPGFKLAHSFTDKRPPMWLDFNRGDSSAAFRSYMASSNILTEQQMNGLHNEYLAALDMSKRAQVVEKAENLAITLMGKRAGLTEDQAKAIAQEGIGRRNKLIAQIKSGDGGKVYGVTSNDGTVVRWPFMESLQVNSVPLKDLAAYDRTFKHHASAIKALGYSVHSGKQWLEDAYEVFNGLWTGMVLLRPGYTVRTLTDDTLRIAASTRGMSLMGQINAGVEAGLGTNIAARSKNVGLRLKSGGKILKTVAEQAGDLLFNEPVRSLPSKVDRYGRDLHSIRTQSALGGVHRGYEINAPYTHKGESYQYVVGSSYDSLASTTDEFLRGMRTHNAGWDVLNPTQEGHLDGWVHAIHNQIAKSEVARKFLEGWSGDRVANWLRGTRDGRAALRTIGKSVKDADEVTGTIQAVVDHTVPLLRDLDDPWILRTMARDGKVTKEALEQLFPDLVSRPYIHGPTIDLSTGTGPVSDALNKLTDLGFRFFGSIPTDKLVRHPFFRSLYLGNTRRLIDNFHSQLPEGERLTSDHLRQAEHTAREMSLQQMNRILFDGSQKSDIANRMRFLTGFFSAWQDSISKWARIAKDNPDIIPRGAMLWNAPNEMNLGSTEEINGKRVPRFTVQKWDKEKQEFTEAGPTYDPFDMNTEGTYIRAKMPEWLTQFLPGVDDEGYWDFDRASQNLVLQGDQWWLPGAGPLAQMAISPYVLAHPTSLKEVRDWALPYGAQDNPIKALAPAWMQRLWESNESITDGSRAFAFMNIALTEDMKAKQGLRERPKNDAEFYKEIEDRTDKFFMLRAFANYVSPFAVQFKSPYQPYIDGYHALRNQDPTTADEKFLEIYGDDFFMFTTALSKNAVGLPASAEAWDKSQALKDQIAKNPEMAAVLVGQVGNPEFDQYVYDAQFKQEIRPGSGKTYREHRSPAEAIEDTRRRQGWIYYTQISDAIDGMALRPGMDPKFIEYARSNLPKVLANMGFTEWAKDYHETYREKIPDTINQLETLLNDNPQLANRDDLATLGNYLAARRQFQEKLIERKKNGGSLLLDTEGLKDGVPGGNPIKDNRDLASAWTQMQIMLAQSNTQFGRVYWRFLQNDRLQFSNYRKTEEGEPL